MKLVRILLENFQSHQRTEIDVDDAITLVTGSSDSGKSSLIRALRWVFFNRAPKGNFMLDPKGTTRVTLTYDTGETLIREKGPKTNQYQLGDKIFKALKSDVPVEVSNFHKVTLDNCQWQYPHYFLLDETPGNVAKRLNEVADLSVMSASLTTAKSFVSTADSAVDQLNAAITGLKDKINGHAWVAEAKASADRAGELQENYEKVQSGLTSLYTALEGIGLIVRRLDEFVDLSGLPVVDEMLGKCQVREDKFQVGTRLIEAIDQAEMLQERLNSLPDVDVGLVDGAIVLFESRAVIQLERREINQLRQKIHELQKKLEGMPDVDDLTVVDGFEVRRRDLTAGKSTLRRAITAVEEYQGKLKVVEITLLDAEEAYEAYKAEIGVCPTCGKEFKGGCCE